MAQQPGQQQHHQGPSVPHEGVDIRWIPPTTLKKRKWDGASCSVTVSEDFHFDGPSLVLTRDNDVATHIKVGDGVSFHSKPQACHGLVTRIGVRTTRVAADTVVVEIRRLYKPQDLLISLGRDGFQALLTAQGSSVRRVAANYDFDHEVFLGLKGDTWDVNPATIFSRFAVLDVACYDAWYEAGRLPAPANAWFISGTYDPDKKVIAHAPRFRFREHTGPVDVKLKARPSALCLSAA